MPDITKALYNIKLLDDFACRQSFIHKIHPLIKFLVTMIYVVIVISFGKYEIVKLMPFVFYPVIIFTISELPVVPIIKRVLLIEPLVIGIGILNPIFNRQMINFGGVFISKGWLVFFSIFIKSSLTITAGILLIATTGIYELSSALRLLKVPKIFVLQFLLTYRYISVLIEEVFRMQRAYILRAPGQKGIKKEIWGPFAGQLILRTFDRAQRVYDCMAARGFKGEYKTGDIEKIKGLDLLYMLVWVVFFIISKCYNLPVIIGSLFV